MIITIVQRSRATALPIIARCPTVAPRVVRPLAAVPGPPLHHRRISIRPTSAEPGGGWLDDSFHDWTNAAHFVSSPDCIFTKVYGWDRILGTTIVLTAENRGYVNRLLTNMLDES
jgi:hypothetical protein